jgi:hypothetical protein
MSGVGLAGEVKSSVAVEVGAGVLVEVAVD